jgi:hypothetical protein
MDIYSEKLQDACRFSKHIEVTFRQSYHWNHMNEFSESETTIFLPGQTPGLEDVGGKGSNLAKLINGGFPVPETFYIGTELYRKFIHGHEEKLNAVLNNGKSASQRSREIKKILSLVPLPKNVKPAIEEVISGFDPGTRFAIRSSATAEDLPNASFAGQQDTYLNVIEDIPEKIKDCFISLFTERAIIYREQQGFDHLETAISVVVQKWWIQKLPESCLLLIQSVDIGELSVLMPDSAWVNLWFRDR